MGDAVHIADGEGFTPVALAAEDRIAQPEVDTGHGEAGGLGLGDGARQGFIAGQAIPVSAVAEHGLFVGLGTSFDVVPFENGRDGQVERLGEFPVALVAGRNGHDGACAVAGQDVISDPDRHRFPGQRVHRVGAGEAPGHAAVAGHALPLAAGGGLLLVGRHGGALALCGDGVNEVVFWSEHEEVGSVQGVRPGGEDLDVVVGVVLDGEAELGARALADPIALDLLDAVGPINGVESVEQAVGVGRDAHHPLAHLLAHHRMAAPLTEAPHHFIIGEHRAEGRTPVDLAVGEVGEAVGHEDAIPATRIECVPLVGRERAVEVVAPRGTTRFEQGVLPDGPC